MPSRTIINSRNFELTLRRLCYQLIENHHDFQESALIGLQQGGVQLTERLAALLKKDHGIKNVLTGTLDVTFFRDDFRRRSNPLVASDTRINFEVESKKIVLLDDVLFTGRTIRSGLDALLSFGRPVQVELLVLIDRRFSRHLPIQPDYVGRTVDTLPSERVEVYWKELNKEDKVLLITPP
ncbi:MAG: bifunctional pyr operon transcriptional regulator/uracil phosphoribosyltransferase PyrR [Flavobacteriales bacterium]|nr:bifunctional pyr operon transcriptional regulator/uracil phosphoribosyltransferase PyrR [Flavobacteriales bacterium]